MTRRAAPNKLADRLLAGAAAAEFEAVEAKAQVRRAKKQLKQARKAFKIAKKAAKQARREAQAASIEVLPIAKPKPAKATEPAKVTKPAKVPVRPQKHVPVLAAAPKDAVPMDAVTDGVPAMPLIKSVPPAGSGSR